MQKQTHFKNSPIFVCVFAPLCLCFLYFCLSACILNILCWKSNLTLIIVVNEIEFIEASQLQQLEKFVRLYYDWDINMEGIDTITHLLQRINIMHNEIATLRNRLKFYESID